MSNMIAGVVLPASVVGPLWLMLEGLRKEPDARFVWAKAGEVYGAVRMLECLQRLNAANAGRLYAYAHDLARQREQELKAKEVAHGVTDRPGV